MSIASEFKEFIMRGNVIDLAVGIGCRYSIQRHRQIIG